jgi:hypothetical protein
MKAHHLPDLHQVLRSLYEGLDQSKILFSSADGICFYKTLAIDPELQKYFDFADERGIYLTQRMQYGMVDDLGVATELMSRVVAKLRDLSKPHN